MHFHCFGAWGDGLRQKKIPPRPCVTDAPWNSREKNFQAERGELGSTSARSNFQARNFLPTEKTLSPGAKEMILFTAG